MVPCVLSGTEDAPSGQPFYAAADQALGYAQQDTQLCRSGDMRIVGKQDEDGDLVGGEVLFRRPTDSLCV